MSDETGQLTIREAQRVQPWTVPYAEGLEQARKSGLIPHALASHCVLHAAKTIGKLAAVFEALDHPASKETTWAHSKPTDAQLATIRAMSADLMTEAMRFANLYGFDLATELLARQTEKNGAQ
jgi:hypothetical protein